MGILRLQSLKIDCPICAKPAVKVSLSQGKSFIIASDDWQKFSKYKWSLSENGTMYYVCRYKGVGKNRKKVYLHREIIPLSFGKVIDHKDGNGLNNCLCNLREVTKSQNNFNNFNVTPHSSKYRGVCFSKSKKDRYLKKWIAYLKKDKKEVFRKRFFTEEEAHKARLGAERRYGINDKSK